MRHYSSQVLVPLAMMLAGPIANAPAGDDLFLPAYQPYTRVAPAKPAATPTTAPGAATAPARSITITLPRISWPKLGGRGRSQLKPV